MSFRISPRLYRFLREERGAVAVTVTVLLAALVGITGAATDLGMLYTARNQLQNAADASALAAADSMMVIGSGDKPVVTTGDAWNNAQNIAMANDALGVNLELRPLDYTIGWWEIEEGGFTRTGDSANPDDLNAVQVTLRRDDLANSPVTTMFARILGFDNVNVSATSVAFLGFAGSVPAGGVDLPIAVDEDAISGDGPLCGKTIEFHDENSENGSWTTFFEWPTNDPTVRQYVNGSKEIPPLRVGDMINIINGNLSQGTFNALYQAFQDYGMDNDGDGLSDEWEVTLPVYKSGGNSGAVELTGFANMTITDVQAAPAKNVVGYLDCGKMVPDSASGTNNYGARATNPKLIN